MNSLLRSLSVLAAKSLLVLAVGFAGSALLRRSAAAARHRWWSLTLLGLLLLPLAQVALPTLPVRVLPSHEVTRTAATVVKPARGPRLRDGAVSLHLV